MSTNFVLIHKGIMDVDGGMEEFIRYGSHTGVRSSDRGEKRMWGTSGDLLIRKPTVKRLEQTSSVVEAAHFGSLQKFCSNFPRSTIRVRQTSIDLFPLLNSANVT